MNNQINLEHKIREILDGEGSAADKIQAIYDDLLPSPLPYPLFLAKATHPDHGEGIVISHNPYEDGTVRFAFQSKVTMDGTCVGWVHSSALTFYTPDTSKNGAEIDTSTAHVDPIDTKPDHPEYLETEVDYRNAPEGTIVADDDEKPAVLVDELWRPTNSWEVDHEGMAGTRRRVLRWGREA